MNILKRTAIAALALASSLTAVAPAFAYERWVDIQNCSDYAIVSVRITHVDDDHFRRDLLGRRTIRAGYEARVEPDVNDGYCLFDIEIVFEDGVEQTLWGQDLCTITTITVDNEEAWTDA